MVVGFVFNLRFVNRNHYIEIIYMVLRQSITKKIKQDQRKRSRCQMTALHDAALRGDAEAVGMLVDEWNKGHGDHRKRNSHGLSALHIAAMNGRTEVARVLIQKGARVNSRNSKGETARTLAVRWGHKDVVQLLKQYGGIK